MQGRSVPASQHPPVEEGFVEVAGHGRMHYLEAGRGDPLVLIHTNGGSVHQYADSVPRLATRFRVIAWGIPGQGDSDPLPRHYSIEDYCAALAAFLDTLGVDTAHVAGCSCGGSISLGFASLYPQRTLSSVIAEMPLRTEPEWRAYWRNIDGNFGIPTQSPDQVRPRLNVVDDAVVARWNADRNKAGAKIMVSMMWAMRRFDTEAHLKKLRCPAMIVFGATGPAIAHKDRFVTAVPEIPIRSLANSGHFPMLDEPEAFARLLEDFCGFRVPGGLPPVSSSLR